MLFVLCIITTQYILHTKQIIAIYKWAICLRAILTLVFLGFDKIFEIKEFMSISDKGPCVPSAKDPKIKAFYTNYLPNNIL